jgi:hypothetical protein
MRVYLRSGILLSGIFRIGQRVEGSIRAGQLIIALSVSY